MEIFLYIILILFAACVWSLIANEITYKQRIKILGLISNDARIRIDRDRDDYLENYDHMNAVSYNDHFLRVFLFQDTNSLYHQNIQELM